MVDDEKRYSRQLLGRTVVSKTGKRFGEIADLEFETRTGEILHLHLKKFTSSFIIMVNRKIRII